MSNTGKLPRWALGVLIVLGLIYAVTEGGLGVDGPPSGESSGQGGVLHWTHHDPGGRRPGGWLEHNGRRYK